MSLLDVTDRWVIPGLGILADWPVRWGALLALFLFWLAFLPPRRAATRYVLEIVLLISGLLLPFVPRWGAFDFMAVEFGEECRPAICRRCSGGTGRGRRAGPDGNRLACTAPCHDR